MNVRLLCMSAVAVLSLTFASGVFARGVGISTRPGWYREPSQCEGAASRRRATV